MQFLKDWISTEKFLTTITRRKGIQIQKIHRVFIEGPGNSQRVVIDEDIDESEVEQIWRQIQAFLLGRKLASQ